VDVRPATDADGPGIAAVRDAIGGQHDDSGSDAAYRAHLMAHGRLFVAVRDGRVIGFAGARDVGGHRLLSDLFVDPQVHGGGVGRVLLATVLDGSEERYTFSSSDPRAMPIYARAGMRPRWPLLYLHGPAPEISTVAVAEAVAVERADADARRQHGLLGGIPEHPRVTLQLVAPAKAGAQRLHPDARPDRPARPAPALVLPRAPDRDTAH